MEQQEGGDGHHVAAEQCPARQAVPWPQHGLRTHHCTTTRTNHGARVSLGQTTAGGGLEDLACCWASWSRMGFGGCSPGL